MNDRRQDSADALRWALLAALGLPLLQGCGGATENIVEGGTDGGDGGGGWAADGGSGGRTSDGGSSGSGGTAGGLACSSPRPFSSGTGASVSGPETGFVRCEEGYRHRPRVLDCPSELPREGALPPGEPLPDYPNLCSRDSDCTGRHPYCETQAHQDSPGTINVCRDGCVKDSECAQGELCECGTPVGHCVAADCFSDADCGRGSRCVGTDSFNGCGRSTRYACARASDSCLSDQDCSGPSHSCQFGSEGNRSCQSQNCAIGRPFLVDFMERRAQLEKRGDWLADLEPIETTGLSERDRGLLASHWSETGLMEHASIPAFARFTLQLISLGAPAGLVDAARAAIVDETRHARLCFAIASKYGREQVGPGEIRMAGALDDLSVESILHSAIVEGCIGETRAALEAARARDLCEDPVVRGVLAVIARDEAQHAELAWRFVSWLLSEYPQLERMFEETVRLGRGLAPTGLQARDQNVSRLQRMGVLGPVEQAHVRQQAWDKVIQPSATSLLRQLRRQVYGEPAAAALVALHS